MPAMLPFNTQFAALTRAEAPFRLPVVIGGATQRGANHTSIQDASGLLIGKHFVIGVVCDGCTSGHNESERPGVASSNEVGARLLATMIPNQLAEFLARRNTLDEILVGRLARALKRALKKIISAACDGRRMAKERFIFDYLTTTILVAVMTEDEYIVFGMGDGMFGVNGDIRELESETGKYFASALLPGALTRHLWSCDRSVGLRIYAKGRSRDVDSIFIGTDGMLDIHRADGELLSAFMRCHPMLEQIDGGIDALVREFRRALIAAHINEERIKDDATFVAIRVVVMGEQIASDATLEAAHATAQ